MAASRIVLDPSIRDTIDQIQIKTRTTSPSAAIALMVSRYARHLLETWELDPVRYTEPNPAQYYSIAASASIPKTDTEFEFSDPIEGL